MLSNSNKYPIHSEIIMSTWSTGNSTSSILAFIITILSYNPLSLTICTAASAISAASIPITYIAPALAAKMLRIPVPQPMSNTTLP
mmetsp:Transcript_17125/g.2830  ORF Transcript_17125/g.2830 Transcript_17125/m.2830 type:complete len:86 (-) Transcript_17125:205-462(-)